MLGLVLPNGHQVGMVDQNIRSHQAGIGEQTAVYIVGVLGAFILKLRHAAQFAKLGIAAQDPVQLGVGGHMALHKQQALLGVNAGGQQHGGCIAGVAAKIGRVLAHGQSVQIGHHIQALKFILQLGPVAHSANIVAQSKSTGGLNAG